MERISTATMTLPLVRDREEGDPDTAEHQHPEGQELGFTEGVRQVPGHVVYKLIFVTAAQMDLDTYHSRCTYLEVFPFKSKLISPFKVIYIFT